MIQKILVVFSVIGLLLICWVNGASRIAGEDYSQQIASYIEFAEQQVELEAYGSAIDSYKKVLLLEEMPVYYYRLAEIYQMAGYINKEIDILIQCMEKYPEEEKAYLQLIEYFYSVGEYADCMKYMEKYAGVFGWKDEMINQYLACKYPYTIKTTGFAEAGDFFRGQVLVKDAVTGKWYYLDSNLKSIKTLECEDASAKLGDIIGVTIDGHPNFVDASGQKYLDSEISYEKTWSFVGKRALVKDSSGYGYVNSRFEMILSYFKQATVFCEGVAAVETEEGWKLIDTSGQQIGESMYSDVKMDEERICSFNKRIFVKEGDSYIMIDTEGNRIGELFFEDAKPFNRGTYAAVKKNGKWGYVDTGGNWRIEAQYENAESFGEELGAVAVGGKWGFITGTNRMAIEPQFDGAKHINNGKAPVKQGDLWFYLCIG